MTNVVTDLLGARVTITRWSTSCPEGSAFSGVVRAVAFADGYSLVVQRNSYLIVVAMDDARVEVDAPAESPAPTDTERWDLAISQQLTDEERLLILGIYPTRAHAQLVHPNSDHHRILDGFVSRGLAVTDGYSGPLSRFRLTDFGVSVAAFVAAQAGK